MTAYQLLVEMITTLVEAEPGLLQGGDRTCIDCMANMQMLGIAHIHQSVVTLPAITALTLCRANGLDEPLPCASGSWAQANRLLA